MGTSDATAGGGGASRPRDTVGGDADRPGRGPLGPAHGHGRQGRWTGGEIVDRRAVGHGGPVLGAGRWLEWRMRGGGEAGAVVAGRGHETAEFGGAGVVGRGHEEVGVAVGGGEIAAVSGSAGREVVTADGTAEHGHRVRLGLGGLSEALKVKFIRVPANQRIPYENLLSHSKPSGHSKSTTNHWKTHPHTHTNLSDH